jgi:outer membrane protein assembly factor BamB
MIAGNFEKLRRASMLVALALACAGPQTGHATEKATQARLIASPEPGWPQFRGPRRDGICDERGLLPAWPNTGLQRLWAVTNIGRGYSSPVIANGRLFISGDAGQDLHILAFDLQGGPAWRATNGMAWKDPYPGARSSVTYSGGRIYHQNAHGRLASYDAATGAESWTANLLDQFGGKEITWGLSECVLVHEETVYANVGGSEAQVVALEKSTGKLRWKSEPLAGSDNGGDPQSASYTSPILVDFAGRKLLIGCSLRHLVCLNAEDGKFQWTKPMPTTHSVLALMPVLVGNAVFITAPHGQGGALFELTAPGGPGGLVGAQELWRTRLDSLQGCVVHLDGRLFGSYYSRGKGLAAVDASNGGVVYEQPEFAKGSILAAEGRLYVLCEDGWMLLLEPGPASFDLRGKFRLAEARTRDAWAHPVIHQARLYLRYHETLSCYDIKARP